MYESPKPLPLADADDLDDSAVVEPGNGFAEAIEAELERGIHLIRRLGAICQQFDDSVFDPIVEIGGKGQFGDLTANQIQEDDRIMKLTRYRKITPV